MKKELTKYSKKPLGSGKGLTPECAVYLTQTDHRRQVAAADRRREKRKDIKQRRKDDKSSSEY